VASSQRQRERYATDETYRERRIRQVREHRERKRKERERAKLLRGWAPISTAPDNEVVLLYDPEVFWPVVAKLDNHRWEYIHYQGPDIYPTHWRYMIEIPKV
jgi:hypothetical protein